VGFSRGGREAKLSQDVASVSEQIPGSERNRYLDGFLRERSQAHTREQAWWLKLFAMSRCYFQKATLIGGNIASQAECFSMKFSNPY
jgi:hypothetical protein